MMRIKNLGVATLAAALMVIPFSEDVFAKGGGGGGGGSRSSFSGGGSSFGRSSPSSSGSSGFFKPSAPSAPVHVTPAPAARPYTPPVPPVQVVRPPSPPVVVQPKAPVQVAPATTPAPVAKPTEKFFAKDTSSTSAFDKKAIEAQKHADSKKAFEAAQARKAESIPKVATSNTQTQNQVPSPVVEKKSASVYDLNAARMARERRIEELSARMARNNVYRERNLRAQQFYGPTYSQPQSQPTPVYFGGSGYNDPYNNPFFWEWLMHRNSQAERDRFFYNHQSEIDPRRLRDMQAAYPDLSSGIQTYRSEGLKPDTKYVPTSLMGNEDLMFGDDVANKAKEKASEVNSSTTLWLVLSAMVLLGSLLYALFGHKWKVKERY